MDRSSRSIQSHQHWSIESNPFRTAAVRPGAIPFCCDDEALMDQLIDLFLRQRSGQILGQHGSGKSTLVSSLVARLKPNFRSTQHLCFVRCESGHRLASLRHSRSVSKQLRKALKTCSPNTLLVVDGAEQLSLLAFQQLLTSIAGERVSVLVTSHQKMRGIPVLYRTRIRPRMIYDLTLWQVRQASIAVRSLVENDLRSRNLASIGNLRDYWFELYDLVQPHLQPCNAYREQHCG